ncbi:inhibitor of growth protein 4-like [Aphis craccivora]|uniref:Inhibitor of growth protein 4-like n=1 Tax=Aphis craccivora TaxID=307492 RepID=A0A6G0Y4J4_APHCR|nr:inhibitor of growth protein 4-like [Aphis craccivora]
MNVKKALELLSSSTANTLQCLKNDNYKQFSRSPFSKGLTYNLLWIKLFHLFKTFILGFAAAVKSTFEISDVIFIMIISAILHFIYDLFGYITKVLNSLYCIMQNIDSIAQEQMHNIDKLVIDFMLNGKFDKAKEYSDDKVLLAKQTYVLT